MIASRNVTVSMSASADAGIRRRVLVLLPALLLRH
jgi:hypothetical protein